MNWGLAVGFGLPIGVALWLVTDNPVFFSAGLVMGIAVGSTTDSSEETQDADHHATCDGGSDGDPDDS